MIFCFYKYFNLHQIICIIAHLIIIVLHKKAPKIPSYLNKLIEPKPSQTPKLSRPAASPAISSEMF
jgi:hypothetical protein